MFFYAIHFIYSYIFIITRAIRKDVIAFATTGIRSEKLAQILSARRTPETYAYPVIVSLIVDAYSVNHDSSSTLASSQRKT